VALNNSVTDCHQDDKLRLAATMSDQSCVFGSFADQAF
jgi:hypothetical protein